jgi:hypothetical protein
MDARDALPALLVLVREQLGAWRISAAGPCVVHVGLRHAGPARARIVETLGWLGLVLDGEANARH